MSSTAHLVVHVDTSDPKEPKFVGAAIYSEGAQSLTGATGRRRFSFDVLRAEGPTYEEARRNLELYEHTTFGVYAWAFELLRKTLRG